MSKITVCNAPAFTDDELLNEGIAIDRCKYIEAVNHKTTMTSKLFLGGVGKLSARTVLDSLASFGLGVMHVCLLRAPSEHIDPNRRTNAGYGYVTFEDDDAKYTALRHQFYVIEGKRCEFKVITRKNNSGPSRVKRLKDDDVVYKLFFALRSSSPERRMDVTEEPTLDDEVLAAYSKFGNVWRVSWARTKSGRKRSFGFIFFTNEESYQAALRVGVIDIPKLNVKIHGKMYNPHPRYTPQKAKASEDSSLEDSSPSEGAVPSEPEFPLLMLPPFQPLLTHGTQPLISTNYHNYFWPMPPAHPCYIIL